MSGLAKLALDAMKAREMARSVGLVPHPGSQWKWALRNLRDGRGDMLQGQALGEAKADLGKLPNNVKQKLLSVVQRTGGDKEVSTVMKQSDPAWNESLATKKMDRSELGNYNPQKRFEDTVKPKRGRPKNVDAQEAHINMIAAPFGPYRIGTTTNTVMASAKDSLAPGTLSRAVHTHPYNPGLLRRMGTQLKEQRADLNDLNDLEDASVNERKMYEGAAKQYDAMIAETERGQKPGPGIVAPSGSVARVTPEELQRGFDRARAEGMDFLPEKVNDQNLTDAQPNGDYKSFLFHEQLHPHLTHNILDPKFGYESVHRMRPEGQIRSIYFHREGR